MNIARLGGRPAKVVLGRTVALKQKVPIHEEIPEAFVESMREVALLIERGDSAATIESDDLLQCGRVCGGLYDEENSRYGFGYLANDYDEDGYAILWYFDLDGQQIEDIAAGRLTSLDMWRCKASDCGRRFCHPDAYCEQCDSPP